MMPLAIPRRTAGQLIYSCSHYQLMHLYLNTKDELQTRSRELMLNAAESGD